MVDSGSNLIIRIRQNNSDAGGCGSTRLVPTVQYFIPANPIDYLSPCCLLGSNWKRSLTADRRAERRPSLLLDCGVAGAGEEMPGPLAVDLTGVRVAGVDTTGAGVWKGLGGAMAGSAGRDLAGVVRQGGGGGDVSRGRTMLVAVRLPAGLWTRRQWCSRALSLSNFMLHSEDPGIQNKIKYFRLEHPLLHLDGAQ